MKGKFLKSYHHLLIQNNFEELEHKLSLHFLTYFGKLLPFRYFYTDWLAEKLRPLRVNLKTYSQQNLCSDYISIEVKRIDPKKFIMFLKFLKFIISLDYKTEILDGDSYRIILFRVKDFLDVSDSHYNSQDEYYKMQKTRDFLRYLQQQNQIRLDQKNNEKLSQNLELEKAKLTAEFNQLKNELFQTQSQLQDLKTNGCPEDQATIENCQKTIQNLNQSIHENQLDRRYLKQKAVTLTQEKNQKENQLRNGFGQIKPNFFDLLRFIY